jgi:hypothetical protein
MTGRISNAKQQRFLIATSDFKSLFTPGKPIDRVMRVLQQVWAGLVDQAISLRGFGQEKIPCFAFLTFYSLQMRTRTG